MELNKYIIEPLDNYLNLWFYSLPFEALERMFGVSLGGVDVDEVLSDIREEWEYMDIEEKVSYHDDWFEKWEGWTSHLITPSLYIPYRDTEF